MTNVEKTNKIKVPLTLIINIPRKMENSLNLKKKKYMKIEF